MTYYFTYGCGDEMDYKGGWTEITAPDEETAINLFMGLHPCRTGGMLICSSVYTEDEFKKTAMYAKGNFGHRAWEKITYWRDNDDTVRD